MKRVLARANLNSKNGELTISTFCARTKTFKFYSRKQRTRHCLCNMNLLRRILFTFVTVLYIGSRNIYSQGINSSLSCSGAKNCQTCVQDFSCFWCETQQLCKVYGVKSKEEETKGCSEWSWKSCQKPDAPLVAIISGCASAALICGRYTFFLP